jgi:hypothetical protein
LLLLLLLVLLLCHVQGHRAKALGVHLLLLESRVAHWEHLPSQTAVQLWTGLKEYQ